MDLVKPKDILKVNPNLSNFGGEYFAKFLMYLLRFRKLNKIYEKVSEKEGVEFIDEIIRMLEIKFEFDESELERLPKERAFITVSNHPFGGLDGILMIKLLMKSRPDVQVLTNYLLKKIEPISGYFLADFPFESDENDEPVTDETNAAAEHLKKGGVLSIFPSGEYSIYDTFNNISDKQWRYPIIKFIKNAGVPIVPIHFQGSNSRLVNVVSKIYPGFKGVKFPTELLNKRNKVIKVRIGNPIRVADQEHFEDIYQFGRYLRAKTYSLETQSNIEVKRFFNYSLKAHPKLEVIIDPVPKEILLKEIQSIKENYTLFNLKNYTVYCTPSRLIPNMLNEIGRLREITFREVGEGTNRSIDIDEFDLYYNQMFIWDDDEDRLVGAYRMGMGQDIIRQYGIRGFYFNSLFRASDEITGILEQSLELGRSFVVREYQRKPMSLFLLWKGILYFLLKNPEYRYMIGPVSISNNYSKISKDLIISFIMKNFFDWEIARNIRPRNSYKFKADNPNLNILMENMEKDINKLDKCIGDLDELNTGLPVLLKKYIKLNAKIIGFNVDPKFNNCLDGLIILDVYDVPKNTIESLSKEINDGSLFEKFYSNREMEERD
ncbi:MAG: lysophospholipid acyltransferase family protein [Prolixibacteraceae bacterium]|nr:lysophospholipid acyltransferase family protein [Prolixibacteraceae bacterium]